MRGACRLTAWALALLALLPFINPGWESAETTAALMVAALAFAVPGYSD